MDSPTVIVADLELNNPMPSNLNRPLTEREVTAIIEASPIRDEALTNFGEIMLEGRRAVIKRASNSYVGYNKTLYTLNCLANDFYPKQTRAFAEIINKVLGYDAVVHPIANGHVHYAVWFTESIQILDRVPVANFAIQSSRKAAPKPL
jgi:hypothetical protein